VDAVGCRIGVIAHEIIEKRGFSFIGEGMVAGPYHVARRCRPPTRRKSIK